MLAQERLNFILWQMVFSKFALLPRKVEPNSLLLKMVWNLTLLAVTLPTVYFPVLLVDSFTLGLQPSIKFDHGH